MDRLTKWPLIFAILLLSITSVKLKLDKDGLAIELERAATVLAVQAESMAAERADLSLKLAQASEDYRNSEAAILKLQAENERKKDEILRIARADADNLRKRLRYTSAEADHATARTEASATATVETFAVGSHGAQLHSEAIFLVDEAERAETIRLSLKQCYDDYEVARHELEALALK